ncbi:hypothetical protein SAY86_017821 [Trapa natans]|uniref:Fatty acyl-CoA reductase n=1 Tax=Trapa natans TaxID=22666 RepID=A0AAN7R5E7_TRANT|nr:hypothetical protein SAY86_017821 [Trapa natans]
MSSISHSFALCHVPSRDSLTKPSYSLPQTVKLVHIPSSWKSRFNILCGALSTRNADAFAATTPTGGSLSNARDKVLLSPELADGRSGSSVVSAMASTVMEPNSAVHEEFTQGLGILKFLEGKTYFVTGATGLLAKAFVEKILRVAPTTRKIFLLVKANGEAEAMKRIKNEIVECELFSQLREMHGEKYRDFIMSKLVPVVGNMCEPELAISDTELAARMADEVDVIVHSAANTSFDERYDVSINMNTQGTLRMLGFAMKCKKLQLYLHVSTGYVNGRRRGVLREKPFYMGQRIAEEMVTFSGTQESFPPPKLDVHAEIELASEMARTLAADKDADLKMRELGSARAKMFGWQDTYAFTKAMAEMIITDYKGQIPVAIVRPSIIESSYQEPFPGWIQGNRMIDPLILYYGKGVLPGQFTDPQAPADIVPVDIVVNTMVGAMAKHGNRPDLELNVYHASSSVINPINFQEIFEFACDYFTSSPLKDSAGQEVKVEAMKYFGSMENFSACIEDAIAERMGLSGLGASSDPKRFHKLQIVHRRKVDSLIRLAKAYEAYTFYQAWFQNENTQKLMKEMSTEELKTFMVDLKSIDWKNYFMNIHIPGLRRHVLKERM